MIIVLIFVSISKIGYRSNQNDNTTKQTLVLILCKANFVKIMQETLKRNLEEIGYKQSKKLI